MDENRKRGLESLATYSALAQEASSADSLDQGFADILIPGGAESIGETRGHEAELMGESQGYKDYQNSDSAKARRAALEALKNR